MDKALDSSKVLKIGGCPGFDFMNTTYKWGERVEVLETPEAFLAWLIDAHLLTDRDVKEIKQRFSASDLTRLLTDALELRARLRLTLASFKAKGPGGIGKEDLLYLNNILRRGSARSQIEIEGKDRIRLNPAHEWNNVEEVLALIVECVFRTLSTVKFDLIKKCANEPCHLYFVDETKAHRRHYCSQAICGNRAKQAAFRERQKKKK